MSSDEQPKFSTMQPGNCFYLHNTESEHTSTPMVLNCVDGSCGLDEFTWDDKNEMFWWDKAADAEWGKVNLGWTDKWLTVSGGSLTTTSDKASAPEFFYEMRDSSLQTKSNGLTYEVTTAKPKKWTPATLTPYKDNIKETDKNAVWRIEYCQWENKPNPEAANEGIPQDLQTKSFPDDWYKTGGIDYEASNSTAF